MAAVPRLARKVRFFIVISVWFVVASGLPSGKKARDRSFAPKLLKEYPDRLRLSRQHQVRRNLRQRRQDKPPTVRARVGQHQIACGQDDLPKRDQVQIQRTRSVQNALLPTPEFLLQALKVQQKARRGFARTRCECHDGIHEGRGPGRAIHRRRSPERRAQNGLAGEFLEPVHGLSDDRPGIAEIRAKRYAGQGCPARLASSRAAQLI